MLLMDSSSKNRLPALTSAIVISPKKGCSMDALDASQPAPLATPPTVLPPRKPANSIPAAPYVELTRLHVESPILRRTIGVAATTASLSCRLRFKQRLDLGHQIARREWLGDVNVGAQR